MNSRKNILRVKFSMRMYILDFILYQICSMMFSVQGPQVLNELSVIYLQTHLLSYNLNVLMPMVTVNV